MELLPEQQNTHPSDKIINGFKELSLEDSGPEVFRNLEESLSNAGFELADTQTVSKILNDNSLYCRSENFRLALDLITEEHPISITNPEQQANMCTMSGSSGYRTAMEEGFGNKEIDGKAKVVVTFAGNNLESHTRIPQDNELWQLKPNTASVSLAGEGVVMPGDVVMVSFRFPTALFPEQMLNEAEMDMLDEAGLPFIVRHYIPKEKAAH